MLKLIKWLFEMLNAKNFESIDGNALRGICFYFVIPNKVLLLFWEKATNHIYKLGDIYINIYWVLWTISNLRRLILQY